MKRVAVILSLLLPLLLLAGMAGQAEWGLRHGVVIRVPITGYDPRDPLRGHFLRYRIVWNWQGAKPAGRIAGLCVLSDAANPPVRPLTALDLQTGAKPPCLRPVQLAETPANLPVGVPDTLFIPEAQAAALQAALVRGTASFTVDLVVAADGSARIKGWQVDGQPVTPP